LKKIVILLLLFGCASESEKSRQEVRVDLLAEDTISIRIFNLLTDKLSKLRTNYEKSGIENDEFRSKIDSLQNDVIKYQTNTIQLKRLELKYSSFEKTNSSLFLYINDLVTKNKSLQDSNVEIKRKLNETASGYFTLVNENQNLKKGIKMTVANVEIKAYKQTRRLFKKNEMVESVTAKEIKQVKISFVVVSEDRITKKIYIITVKIKGAGDQEISKQVVIDYKGLEIEQFVLFDEPQEYRSGSHPITIFADKTLLYEGLLVLE
jgi:hypothetical protein